ncbi:MAG: 2-isopropylmalate synthase [Candidatus Latescibacteria bacterium]|jgi:2-isopropylmalate synthase|nr:2-isopropylmalate synthase [Candidatus Latescibacterota bacterium]MBT5832383.1 2-isopropylmalate synthase [Candidatus Latescibacterota bacterium]
MANSDNKNRVIIFDTTLRDAEQTPGASLTVREKIEIAYQLAKLNVDVIEAGFPISSDEDFTAVRRIGQEVEGPIVCGLARAIMSDIDRAGEALKGAPKPRIHTFIGTSAHHISMVGKSPADVKQMAVNAVERAKSHCDDVEFSPMDAARTEPDYLHEVIEATIAAGATTINIPDTVGYAVPEQFGTLIRNICKKVPNVDQAVLSVHCHDDLGMATINALAALTNGARQVECTMNGLGERAGNTSLEEVVMAITTRGDYFGLHTQVKTTEIVSTSRLVSRLMGIVVPPNKPIVGANAFAHSSGIHQDGVLKSRENFEIMDPTSVGWTESSIVLTARSGRHALRHRLEELGFKLNKEEINQAYERFVKVADKKKEVFDDDLMAIVEDEIRDIPARYQLDYLHTVSGTSTVPSATVRLKIDGEDDVQESAWGDGPVDATYQAIKTAVKTDVKVKEYGIRAITSGAEALGEVTVTLTDAEKNEAKGRGVSTDVIEASAKAFLDALNRLTIKQTIPKREPTV